MYALYNNTLYTFNLPQNWIPSNDGKIPNVPTDEQNLVEKKFDKNNTADEKEMSYIVQQYVNGEPAKDEAGQYIYDTRYYESDEMLSRVKASMYEKKITSNRRGLRIDLNTGIMTGYDLYLKGVKNNTNESEYVLLDSSAETYPFQIGPNFKVGWDGELICNTVRYLGTGPKTGDYVINIADHFVVNSNGSGSAPGMSVGYAGGAGSATIAEEAKVLLGTGGYPSVTAGDIADIIENHDNLDYKVTLISNRVSALESAGYLTALPKHNHAHELTDSMGGNVTGTIYNAGS